MATHALAVHEASDPRRAPLILLHGSDGTELDLMPFAEEVSPSAARIGISGSVLMEDGYGFFRRFPDRSVDGADLTGRVPALSRFIRESCDRHAPHRRPVVIGYSNGAIMGAALVMSDATLTAGAVLLRPLQPYEFDPDVRLDGIPVLIIDGEDDARRSAGDGLTAADQLRRLGAEVTHRVLPVGHPITDADRAIVRHWLQRNDF